MRFSPRQVLVLILAIDHVDGDSGRGHLRSSFLLGKANRDEDAYAHDEFKNYLNGETHGVDSVSCAAAFLKDVKARLRRVSQQRYNLDDEAEAEGA